MFYFLINIKHIILGCALCFMTFTVLHVNFVAFMQDSCSDFGEYVMNIIYYCKLPYYPGTISRGFTWISKVEAETRLNTAWVRIVPENGPKESVVETVWPKQGAFWMGCHSKKKKKLAVIFFYLFTVCMILLLMCTYSTWTPTDRVFIYWRSLAPG